MEEVLGYRDAVNELYKADTVCAAKFWVGARACARPRVSVERAVSGLCLRALLSCIG